GRWCLSSIGLTPSGGGSGVSLSLRGSPARARKTGANGPDDSRRYGSDDQESELSFSRPSNRKCQPITRRSTTRKNLVEPRRVLLDCAISQMLEGASSTSLGASPRITGRALSSSGSS